MALQLTQLRIPSLTTDYSAETNAAGALGKTIAGMPSEWRKQAEAEQKRQLFATAAQGGDLNKIGLALLGAGDVQGGAALLGLGQKAEERKAEAAWFAGNGGGGAPAAPAGAPLAALGNPNEIESRFVNTVKGAGLTNPVGLGAVAAYGKAESGFAPQNVNRSWSDPSESGQPGTAGGIMSWRAERLQNLQKFAQQRGESQPSVETQALFLSQEDPTLIPKLQSVQTPQEANQIMANAWRFAGYNRPGGENARREALTTQYAQRYGGQGGPAPAIPVQVAQNEADVQRLEAQQGNPVIDAPGPVQVAQAPGPAADMPATGAQPAQGFSVPGATPQQSQSIAADPQVQLWSQRLATAPTDRARAVAKQRLDLAVADAKQRMDEGGPLTQEGKRLSNEKARRDLEGKGFRTLNSAERVQAGVPPEYKGVVQIDRDGQLHFPGKAATEVNVEGNIPAGYQIERDAQGKAVRMAPIPGGPAAEKEAAAAEKDKLRKEQTQATGNVVLTALDDIDRLMKEATLPTTGALGSRVADIKGTSAHDIKNALVTIGANISFDKLAEMRASSPTGGALGAVTENELTMLQNSLAALQQSSSEGQFKANLGRVRANFERVVHGRRLSDQERKADGPMTGERAKSLRAEAQAAIAGGAPREEVAKRLKEKYGITPEGL